MSKSSKDFVCKKVEQPTHARSESSKRFRTSPEQGETSKVKKRDFFKEAAFEMEGSQVGKMTLKDLLAQIGLLIDSKGLASKEDVNEIKLQMNELKDENDKLKQEVLQLREKVRSVERRLDSAENSMKRNTLIFRGLEGLSGTDYEVLRNFCQEVLGVAIAENDVENLYNISISNSNKKLLKVTFVNNRIVMNILKNTRKLKDTGFYIDKDYSWAVRNRRRKLFQYRKLILSKDSSKKIAIRRDNLILNGRKYYWDEEGDCLKTVDGDFQLEMDLLPEPASMLQPQGKNK